MNDILYIIIVFVSIVFVFNIFGQEDNGESITLLGTLICFRIYNKLFWKGG